MKFPTLVLLALVAAAGSFVFFKGVPISVLSSQDGSPVSFDGVAQRTIAARPKPGVFDAMGVERRGTIRIGTFNLDQFGVTKASKPHVMDMLAQICRRFDVIAVQEIGTLDQTLLAALVDTINHGSGLAYDYIVGPRVGSEEHLREQFAFIFDSQTLDVDRGQFYTVDDPDGLMNREPLVGWFRARGPSPDRAFTFTLVNVHTDEVRVDEENGLLPGLIRVIQSDGRQEDDVILVGDFNASSRHLEDSLVNAEVTWAISSSVPTNIEGTDQFDNIGFVKTFTDEFTGRAGALDFLREFNLNVATAREISGHIPVWAEFSVFEGGTPGRIAAVQTETQEK